jgi:hypothetical protein
MKLVRFEKDFGWTAFLELNPEVSGSLWLKVSVIGEGGGVQFELYPGICLKLRKSTENTSQSKPRAENVVRHGNRLDKAESWPGQ